MTSWTSQTVFNGVRRQACPGRDPEFLKHVLHVSRDCVVTKYQLGRDCLVGQTCSD